MEEVVLFVQLGLAAGAAIVVFLVAILAVESRRRPRSGWGDPPVREVPLDAFLHEAPDGASELTEHAAGGQHSTRPDEVSGSRHQPRPEQAGLSGSGARRRSRTGRAEE